MSAPQNAELNAALRLGAEHFDRGAFFEAHEAWEAYWRVSRDEQERLLLQGLIQVAAAFHKLFVAHAREPAQRLLARGLDKLDRVLVPGAACREFDLASFRSALHACSPALSGGVLERNGVPRLCRVAPDPRA